MKKLLLLVLLFPLIMGVALAETVEFYDGDGDISSIDATVVKDKIETFWSAHGITDITWTTGWTAWGKELTTDNSSLMFFVTNATYLGGAVNQYFGIAQIGNDVYHLRFSTEEIYQEDGDICGGGLDLCSRILTSQRGYLESTGETQNLYLIWEDTHGTNPKCSNADLGTATERMRKFMFVPLISLNMTNFRVGWAGANFESTCMENVTFFDGNGFHADDRLNIPLTYGNGYVYALSQLTSFTSPYYLSTAWRFCYYDKTSCTDWIGAFLDTGFVGGSPTGNMTVRMYSWWNGNPESNFTGKGAYYESGEIQLCFGQYGASGSMQCCSPTVSNDTYIGTTNYSYCEIVTPYSNSQYEFFPMALGDNPFAFEPKVLFSVAYDSNYPSAYVELGLWGFSTYTKDSSTFSNIFLASVDKVQRSVKHCPSQKFFNLMTNYRTINGTSIDFGQKCSQQGGLCPNVQEVRTDSSPVTSYATILCDSSKVNTWIGCWEAPNGDGCFSFLGETIEFCGYSGYAYYCHSDCSIQQVYNPVGYRCSGYIPEKSNYDNITGGLFTDSVSNSSFKASFDTFLEDVGFDNDWAKSFAMILFAVFMAIAMFIITNNAIIGGFTFLMGILIGAVLSYGLLAIFGVAIITGITILVILWLLNLNKGGAGE